MPLPTSTIPTLYCDLLSIHFTQQLIADAAAAQTQQGAAGAMSQMSTMSEMGLVEAAQPDLSPAQVDAVVAEINTRMTMGSKQCCLTTVLKTTARRPPAGQFNQRPVRPAKSQRRGDEYQQHYKLVNDRLPKGKQWLHRAAKYRRGIDGRARNNA
ncbi:hypothetical protein QJQ45_013258 [Haematococcus lacustris]|nr:hypothetical protein QJQ45_013258 [Haematococcus lacustris]